MLNDPRLWITSGNNVIDEWDSDTNSQIGEELRMIELFKD